MKTWAQIKTELRNEIWPFPTEAKVLIGVHDKFFLEGIMDLQACVECLQANNTRILGPCSTYFRNGQTVFEAPAWGVVKRLYTIANDNWEDPVFYNSVTFEEIECWSRNLLSYTQPDNEGLPTLPMGFRFADASSDVTDCGSGRARMGIWAIYRHRLYIAPWIQSNEKVVVEWDGVKGDWVDSDALDTDIWHPRVLQALRTYVEWKHEFRFGNDISKAREYERTYLNQRADLIFECRESIKQQEAKYAESCVNARGVTTDELEDDETPAGGSTEIAVIGDYAENTTARDEVAEMVHGWEPEIIVSTGDNWYGSVITTLADLEEKNEPYLDDIDAEEFYAAIGNHDRDPEARLAIEMARFNFPKQSTPDGNIQRPYYQLVRGHMHLFFIDTGYDNDQVNQQADGVTKTSKQAAWLRVALARSLAPWKIVIGHHTPFTSFEAAVSAPTLDSNGKLSYPEIRWPFKSWGAHLYLNGHVHAYERIYKDGLNYITCGAGGASLASDATRWDDPIDESQLRYFAQHGAMKLIATCDLLTGQFYNKSGTLIDEFEVEKP